MPTASDEKLAENLANFRVEVAERFGKVDERLAGVETELRMIRKLGTWLLGGVFGSVAALVMGAATVAWSASAVISEVKNQGQRIGKLASSLENQGQRIDKWEGSLDAIRKQLEILVHRTETKTGADHHGSRTVDPSKSRPETGASKIGGD